MRRGYGHNHIHIFIFVLTNRLMGQQRSQSLECMRAHSHSVPSLLAVRSICPTQLKMCITRNGRLFGGRQRFGSTCLPSPATNGLKSVYPSASKSVRPSVRSVHPTVPHHLLAAFEVHYNVNGGDNVTYLQLFFILEHSVMPTKRKLYKRMC